MPRRLSGEFSTVRLEFESLGVDFVCFRLASILEKRTLATAKLDEIKVRANILGAFHAVQEKVAQAEEKVEDFIAREAAEL